ncbi:phage tail terminator protein, partial [Aeromonas caviae]
VFVATDLEAVANLGQHTPAIHVIYQGERESETSQSGRQSAFEQVWLLVLVHRATPKEASAGVWLGRMLQAVAGRACGD